MLHSRSLAFCFQKIPAQGSKQESSNIKKSPEVGKTRAQCFCGPKIIFIVFSFWGGRFLKFKEKLLFLFQKRSVCFS